jgi:RNA polymerase sigma-70 factor (ECF subfamily)
MLDKALGEHGIGRGFGTEQIKHELRVPNPRVAQCSISCMRWLMIWAGVWVLRSKTDIAPLGGSASVFGKTLSRSVSPDKALCNGILTSDSNSRFQSAKAKTTDEPTLSPTVLSMTDEQAMWRVQTEDDHQAFAKLVTRWGKPIFQLCARLTGDAHRGEDLKQEAFSRVFARRKDYHATCKFSTWLWRIALNLCDDELRRKQRTAKHLLEPNLDSNFAQTSEFPSDDAAPDLRLVQNEESELVRKALLLLDEEHRTVIVLRYCEGLKLREISDLLNLPESTIHSRIAVGLARLTRIIEPQFETRND